MPETRTIVGATIVGLAGAGLGVVLIASTPTSTLPLPSSLAPTPVSVASPASETPTPTWRYYDRGRVEQSLARGPGRVTRWVPKNRTSRVSISVYDAAGTPCVGTAHVVRAHAVVDWSYTFGVCARGAVPGILYFTPQGR